MRSAALQEKAQQLAVSHTARERLAEQLQQAQAQLAQSQAALKKLQAKQQGGTPGGEPPGTLVLKAIKVRFLC